MDVFMVIVIKQTCKLQWRCRRCQYEYKSKQRTKLAQIFLIQQNCFTNKTKIKTEFESMEVNEMNKCLSYVSITRKGSNFYKKTSLLSRHRQVLHQTAWFISIYFGKLVGETQHSFTEIVKICLIETAEKP